MRLRSISVVRSLNFHAHSELKLVATPEQLAHVKETRLDFVQRAKEAKSSALANVDEEEWRDMVGSLDLPKVRLAF